MTRAELLAELRDVLNVQGANVTWRDTTLLGYLSEGQDIFCEKTGYFVDLSNFTITLQTGVANYAIPDRIYQILEIWDGSRKLGKVLQGSEPVYDEWPMTVPNETGTPRYWQTDKETGVITLTPTPIADDNGDIYQIQAWRYSLYDLAGKDEDGADAQPEIPSRFHRALIEWAAFKAFSHHDMEAQDPVKASDHYAMFKMYVTDAKYAFRKYHNMETRVGTNSAYRT